MDSSQLLKGVLPTTALALLDRADTYGYQVLSDLREAGLTHRWRCLRLWHPATPLRRAACCRPTSCRPVPAPSRRYYALTADGRAALKAGRDEWREFQATVTALLAEFDEDEEEAS